MIMQSPAPAWLKRAREIQARVHSPVDSPFAAKKQDKIAKLYIYDMIGEDPWTGGGVKPADIAKALDEAAGATDLEVYLNSPGGYVFDGIAIYNTIRQFKAKRTVYVDGLAASIASIIALAGDRVVTNEGAMWMVHDPMGGLFSWGTADQIEDDARKTVASLRKARENLIDIYAGATEQSVAQLSAWMTGETWMTASEALERGFTDEIALAPKAADEEERPAAKASAFAPSPRTVAAQARDRIAHLSKLYPRAIPGPADGQPKATIAK